MPTDGYTEEMTLVELERSSDEPDLLGLVFDELFANRDPTDI
jgi:hypothetical protein